MTAEKFLRRSRVTDEIGATKGLSGSVQYTESELSDILMTSFFGVE